VIATHEHEFEAAPGLPEPLPVGEKLLWQGAPQWQQLALHAFHVGKIAAYFLIMLAFQLAYLIESHIAVGEIAVSILKSFVMGSVALALLSAVAWFSSKTTIYTITDKRVIMRIGIVLTLTFNLPHKRISAASMKNLRGNTGDIALSLYPTDRIAWLHLWPHARAWRLTKPEPALRCIKDAGEVGQILLHAWKQAQPGERSVTSNLDTTDTAVPAGEGVPA
jgi:hypothetical protein